MVIATIHAEAMRKKKIRPMSRAFLLVLGLCNSPCGIHAGLYELQEVLATLCTLVSRDLVRQHVSDDVQATFGTLACWELVGKQVFS